MPAVLALEHLREAILNLETHCRREEHEHTGALVDAAMVNVCRALAVLLEMRRV